jgi:hypothetical protein
VGAKVTQTTTLKEIADWLRTVKKRPNFNPKVCIIDNVPPQLLDAEGRVPTEIIDLIVECLQLKSREYVIQDKFHVSHSFSPFFGNTDPRFWEFVIRDWRHAVSFREGEAFDTVKSAIKAGKVQKKCKFRGETVQLKMGEVKSGDNVDKWIDDAVASGLFDEMFTLCDKPVVPLHVKSAAALRNEVPAWVERIVEASFAPAGANAVRETIKCNGKTLIASESKLRKIGQNALKRILNCVPPDDVRELAWTKTGEQDHNGFDVYSSNFHSCAAESWNSSQGDFVCGANVTKEKATALHFEGNVRQLMRKEVKLARQEALGTYNPTDAWEANRYVGYDAQHRNPDWELAPLLAHRPIAVDEPPAVGADEVCVQAIGSFAKGSNGGKRARISAGDPSVRPTLALAVERQQRLSFSVAAAPLPALDTTSPPSAVVAAVVAAPAAAPIASAAVVAAPAAAPIASSSAAAVSAIAQAAFALSHAVNSMASSNPQAASAQPADAYTPPFHHPSPPSAQSLLSHLQPAQSREPPLKRAKTRAQANSRACKWPCMCKTEEQKRPGARGGDRAECLPACPKFAWMRDPGWPHTPTIADSPAIGARFSYLPSSGKEGMIEYCGRNEWRPVESGV